MTVWWQAMVDVEERSGALQFVKEEQCFECPLQTCLGLAPDHVKVVVFRMADVCAMSCNLHRLHV